MGFFERGDEKKKDERAEKRKGSKNKGSEICKGRYRQRKKWSNWGASRKRKRSGNTKKRIKINLEEKYKEEERKFLRRL